MADIAIDGHTVTFTISDDTRLYLEATALADDLGLTEAVQRGLQADNIVQLLGFIGTLMWDQMNRDGRLEFMRMTHLVLHHLGIRDEVVAQVPEVEDLLGMAEQAREIEGLEEA